LALQFAGLARKEAGHRIAHTLGVRRYAELDEPTLKLPDSRICRDALQMVASVSPPFLLNHCIRGYVFGAALGARDRIRFDPELLFLACVMHDLGLTTEHDGPDDFELEGARAAHAWMSDRGERAERAAIIHEAIALHTSVGRAPLGAPEVKLTHLGVGVDIIGLRAEDFRREDLVEAANRWPRHDFKRCFPPLIQDQAVRKPTCSIAALSLSASPARSPALPSHPEHHRHHLFQGEQSCSSPPESTTSRRTPSTGTSSNRTVV
jgi:hypothetical protein